MGNSVIRSWAIVAGRIAQIICGILGLFLMVGSAAMIFVPVYRYDSGIEVFAGVFGLLIGGQFIRIATWGWSWR